MKRVNTASEIPQILCGLQGLELLLRVGLQRNLVAGLDLLACCAGGTIDIYAKSIMILLKNHWPTADLFISDDSVRFKVQGNTGGIAVHDLSVLITWIKEWIKGKNLNGQHRQWTTGYWLPEALCGDLATAKVIHDPRGVFNEIRELIIPYSPSLSLSVVALCTDEIKQKLLILESLLGKGQPLELNLCLSDITAAMIRLSFARSHCYFRGFKSLASQALLLKSSDLPIYELAFSLVKRKRPNNLLGRIRRILL